jgi:3-dehydroquinate dehydratase-2
LGGEGGARELRIAVVNGPNLNLLGTREPELYGTRTLGELEALCREHAGRLGCELTFFQANSEGALIDHLQSEGRQAGGVILNPAALTHYSYALLDCVRALSVPVVEVHLSNLYARPEPWRRVSVTAPAARGIISGLGFRGYLLAMEFLLGND